MKWLKPGKTNKEERMNFVKYWAEYVRAHPDKVWGKQQNVFRQFIQEISHLKQSFVELMKKMAKFIKVKALMSKLW